MIVHQQLLVVLPIGETLLAMISSLAQALVLFLKKRRVILMKLLPFKARRDLVVRHTIYVDNPEYPSVDQYNSQALRTLQSSL